MTTVDVDAIQAAAERLMALADYLGQRGFATHLVRTAGGLRLRVTHRTVGLLSEDVYAAPAGDGAWWFWWSWAEQITGIEDVTAAAAKIAHVLTPRHG